MNSNTNILSMLDVDLPVPSGMISQSTELVVPDVSAQTNNSITQDSIEARNNIRKLIEQGFLASSELLRLTQTSQSPRAYEVFAQMIKTVSELNHDLIKVHKEEQILTGPPPEPDSGDVNIEKAVFVGSTSELSDMMKQQKLKQNAHSDEAETEEEI